MALDTKTKKFVDFYLSELLGHVKSMSEQRLGPVEHQAAKKIVTFLAQSGSPLSQMDALASVNIMRPLYEFLQKIIGQIQQSDFKMSQVISVIESDSEKILQVFAQILSDASRHRELERELQRIGLPLDMDMLKRTYAQATIEKAPALVPVKTPPVVSTEPMFKTEPTAFSKVDDMIGFLSRRSKKTPEGKTSVPASKKIYQPPSPGDDYTEGKNSDRSEFLTELDDGIHALGNALKQLRTDPSKTRRIIETADAFGLIKKTAKIFDLPSLRDYMIDTEQKLNNIADNLDDQKLKLSDDSVAALEAMAKTLGQIYHEKLFPLTAGILQELSRASDNFQNSFTMREAFADIDPEEKAISESKRISLDIAHIADEDWKVFREQAWYNFEIITSAVRKLKNSSSDTEAVKDIHRAARALHTSSKLLRLSFLAAHYEILYSIFKEMLQTHEPISDELRECTEASVQACSALVQHDFVTDAEWLRINTGLMKFTDYKESPGDSKTAEASPISETGMANKEKINEALPSVLEANEHWVEEFQNILMAHNHIALSPVEEKGGTPRPKSVNEERRAPEVSVKKEVAVEQPAEIKAKSAEKITGGSSAEKMHVEIPEELINAMARGELNISDRTILNFAERLSVEPQDILTPGEKKIRIKAVKKITAGEKVESPVPAKREIPKTVRGSLILQETNAASVDPEILDIFNQESAGYFKTIDQAFEKLRTNIKDDGALKDLERVSHSLKSSSRMLGFERVSGLSGAMELIAERSNENELVFTKEILELVGSVAAAIRTIVAGQKADVTPVIQKLFNLESAMSAPSIFTSHIPGALEAGVLETDETGSTESKAAVEQTGIPEAKPVEEKAVAGEKAPVEENYFKKLGVDEEIVEIFKEESLTYFKLMAGALQTLRSDMTHEGALHDIEKSAHSLRSSAKMLGFQKIGNLARPIEAIAERINEGALDLDTAIWNMFESAVQLLQTLARGTDVDVENVLTQLSRVEKLPSNAVKMEKRDSTQAIQSIKDQLADKSVTEKKVLAKESKPVRKKTVRAPAEDFDDIEVTKDPILKQLSHEEGDVLGDMSLSTQKEVH